MTLENDRYELYYTWQGETDACTVSHAHWHRFSGGTFSSQGDELVFAEGSVNDTLPGWGGRSPGTPTGHRDGSFNIRVTWGSLRLQYARW